MRKSSCDVALRVTEASSTAVRDGASERVGGSTMVSIQGVLRQSGLGCVGREQKLIIRSARPLSACRLLVCLSAFPSAVVQQMMAVVALLPCSLGALSLNNAPPHYVQALRGFASDFEATNQHKAIDLQQDGDSLDDNPMQLILFNESTATTHGARCLDGSPSGYYYRAGKGDS